MQYNYEAIKALAKQTGLRVTDLIALASQNDPFYVGTPTDIKNAEWFADVWGKTGYTQGHLRRIHYWTISQSQSIAMPNGLPYENTERCWEFINIASKKARYLGRVDIESITDSKNPAPHLHAQYSRDELSFGIERPDLSHPAVYVSGINHVDAQPYHQEVWCEKSTMNDVLIPLTQRYSANLATFEGEVSTKACFDLAIKRIEQSGGKPTRIWYISDFDPAGNSMPVAMARKVEFMLRQYNRSYDVRVEPIALTVEQVQHYQLPRIPIKDSESRGPKFERSFGTGAVELDALEALYPGELERIVGAELERYYSSAAEQEAQHKEQRLRQAVAQQVNAITNRYQAEIDAIQAMLEEIQQIEIDNAGEYRINPYLPHVAENGHFLFDSRRDYLDQLSRYKAHKGGDLNEP